MAILVTIEAEARERAGKGAARATRRQGKLPAVIYGAKQAPTMISIDPKTVVREMHRGGWRSRLFEIKHGGETTRALMRDVAVHPVTDIPEHVDFQRLAPGEKMKIAVSVHFSNDAISPGIKRGGMLNVVRHTVECYVDPDNVPDQFDADLSALEINDNLRWSNLTGTDGIRPVIQDRDFVIATVAAPTKMPEVVVDGGTPAGGTKAPAKPAAKKK
jgi:large subunit ribosomal protein L25